MKELSLEKTAALGEPVLDTSIHCWQVEIDGVVRWCFSKESIARDTMLFRTSAFAGIERGRTGRVLCGGVQVGDAVGMKNPSIQSATEYATEGLVG